MLLRRAGVAFLIVILTLALANCAKRRKGNAESGKLYGSSACDGAMGQFDLYLIPSEKYPGVYELNLHTIALLKPGQIVRIVLANSDQEHKEVIPSIILEEGQTVFTAYMGPADLRQYPLIVIARKQPGVDFLGTLARDQTTCEIPTAGTTISGDGGYFDGGFTGSGS